MSRVEITVGLLAIVGAIFITALVGLGEASRMPRAEVGFEMRQVENGAALFDQYCASCHGQNASGGMCPPLNEASGLYGGDLGAGVAWRLEQLGWDRNTPYEYVASRITSGVAVSTRPQQYPGNRVAGAGDVMAMPAWSQRAGGPLRDDQIADLAMYLANFREAIPDDRAAAQQVVGLPAPPTPVTATGGITATAVLSPTVDLATGSAEKGQSLFASATCTACHAVPGLSESIVGPSMVGLAARAAERLADPAFAGRATSLETYVFESVRNPNAFVVKEFANPAGLSTMVQFGADRLTDQDIADLIAYLKQAGG